MLERYSEENYELQIFFRVAGWSKEGDWCLLQVGACEQ
jgi:hypothetical protein